MAATDLQLEAPGTIARPGPVGRLARLAFGAMCVFYVVGLIDVQHSMLNTAGHIRGVIWNGILPGLFLVSYVVNIGYSRGWKKWPAIVSGGALLLVAAYGFHAQGMLETEMLAQAIWVWELYIFAHLGLSFLLSALLGTPGCEMRAMHDLWAKLTGNQAREHLCPVGPLCSIDRWESGR